MIARGRRPAVQKMRGRSQSDNTGNTGNIENAGAFNVVGHESWGFVVEPRPHEAFQSSQEDSPMRRYFRTSWTLSLVVMLAGVAAVSVAQERGGRGRGQGFDPAEMRARMTERMQEMLDVKDDEWEVISPLLEDVMEKQGQAGRGGFPGRAMFMGGRGRPDGAPGARGERGPEGRERAREGRERGREGRGRGGPFGGEPDPEVEALRDLLDSPDASKSDIQAKLKDLRNSRKEKAKALQTAREELRKVLTLRQEATLVLMGMLD